MPKADTVPSSEPLYCARCWQATGVFAERGSHADPKCRGIIAMRKETILRLFKRVPIASEPGNRMKLRRPLKSIGWLGGSSHRIVINEQERTRIAMSSVPTNEALSAALARAEARLVQLRRIEEVDPSYEQRSERIAHLDGWIGAVKALILGHHNKGHMGGCFGCKALAAFVVAFPERSKDEGEGIC